MQYISHLGTADIEANFSRPLSAFDWHRAGNQSQSAAQCWLDGARGMLSNQTSAVQWSATSAIFFGRLLCHQSFGQYSSYFHQTNKVMIIAWLLWYYAGTSKYGWSSGSVNFDSVQNPSRRTRQIMLLATQIRVFKFEWVEHWLHWVTMVHCVFVVSPMSLKL